MNAQAIALFLVFFLSSSAIGQGNGNLQLHFINVGQGDGALMVSPAGETVMFDNGVRNDCDRVIAYLQQLGVSHIDYHIASHYHDDHIGCTVPVLYEFPLQKQAYDRGGTYGTKTFRNYTNVVKKFRKTAMQGAFLTLDADSPAPVRIEFVALNGNGTHTSNENDLSLVCVVRWGQFDVVIGGDLSGYNSGNYKDIETSVAASVGQVEVYKINHHGSKHSSNSNWLQAIRPKIGIISCGTGNKHRHPTRECLRRLHDADVVTYWTEAGNGATPVPGKDKIGGNIIVEVAPNATTFTVTYNGVEQDVYQVWDPVMPGSSGSFAWSKLSSVYHFSSCSYVQSIRPNNLQTNSALPAGKRLHIGCPK